MTGPSIIPCADPKCGHPLGHHAKTDKLIHPGRCRRVSHTGYTVGHSSRCACQVFVWEPHEEDPDALWNDYKDGYADIDGNYIEPSNEP